MQKEVNEHKIDKDAYIALKQLVNDKLIIEGVDNI